MDDAGAILGAPQVGLHDFGFGKRDLKRLPVCREAQSGAEGRQFQSQVGSQEPGPAGDQNLVQFMAQIENLSVEPDSPAKVVIDEVAGVIVMGDAVRVSTVAIQQGNLTITVREQPAVSQPGAFARVGETAVIPQSDVSVEEEKGKQFLTVRSGTSLSNLVAGLNALGVTPRDMISILQTIKAAGALQAEIEVM